MSSPLTGIVTLCRVDGNLSAVSFDRRDANGVTVASVCLATLYLFVVDNFLRASQPVQADGQLDLRAMGGRTLNAHAELNDACRYTQVGHSDLSGIDA